MEGAENEVRICLVRRALPAVASAEDGGRGPEPRNGGWVP